MKRLLSIALFGPSLMLAAAAPGQPAMPPTLPAPAAAAPAPPQPAASQSPAHADVPPPAQTLAAPAKTEDAPPDAAAIPQAFPRDRYETSWKKNPFLLKVAVVAQAKESWGTDFALTSIAKISGIYRVSIKNKKTGESKRLTEGSDANGEFKIVSVNLQPDRKSSSVVIEKGGDKVPLTYDATMMSPQVRGGAPGAGRPGMPTIPGQPGGNIPAPTIRTTGTGGGQVGGPGGMRTSIPGANGSYQQAQMGGGSPGYTGNVGGAYGGGAGGVPGGSNASAGGNAAGSRLGAVGPRAGFGGTQQNSLVPTVGGTRVTGTNAGGTYTGGTNANGTYTGGTTFNGTNAGGVSAAINQGNGVAGTTDAATTNADTSTTTTGSSTQVTRRRTLIPAPVVNP